MQKRLLVNAQLNFLAFVVLIGCSSAPKKIAGFQVATQHPLGDVEVIYMARDLNKKDGAVMVLNLETLSYERVFATTFGDLMVDPEGNCIVIYSPMPDTPEGLPVTIVAKDMNGPKSAKLLLTGRPNGIYFVDSSVVVLLDDPNEHKAFVRAPGQESFSTKSMDEKFSYNSIGEAGVFWSENLNKFLYISQGQNLESCLLATERKPDLADKTRTNAATVLFNFPPLKQSSKHVGYYTIQNLSRNGTLALIKFEEEILRGMDLNMRVTYYLLDLRNNTCIGIVSQNIQDFNLPLVSDLYLIK